MIWRKESDIHIDITEMACAGQCSKCGCQDRNLHVTITFFGCLNHQAGNMHNFTSWYNSSVLGSDAFKTWWDAWPKQIDFKINRIEMTANVAFLNHMVSFCFAGWASTAPIKVSTFPKNDVCRYQWPNVSHICSLASSFWPLLPSLATWLRLRRKKWGEPFNKLT